MSTIEYHRQMILEKKKNDLWYMIDWRNGARRCFNKHLLKKPDSRLRTQLLNELFWMQRRCRKLKEQIHTIETALYPKMPLSDDNSRETINELLRIKDLPKKWWPTAKSLDKNGTSEQFSLLEDRWETYLLVWRRYKMPLDDEKEKIFSRMLEMSLIERFKTLGDRRTQKRVLLATNLDGVIPACIVEIAKNFI